MVGSTHHHHVWPFSRFKFPRVRFQLGDLGLGHALTDKLPELHGLWWGVALQKRHENMVTTRRE